MSLQVWLPMTKDLRQQGLSDVEVINNGTTFNSAGKLGGTYSATTSGQTISINFSNLSTMLANGKTYSLACWVKPTGTPSSGWVIKLGDNTCGLWWAKSAARWVWNENDGGKRCANETISSDYTNWHHLAIVVDKTISGKITTRQYVDGTLADGYPGTTWDSSSHSQPTGTIITISPYVSQLNDIRLYDHALSPMEVKQLSQGLVLHYPLNREGWGQENLFNWPNNATGITLNDYQNKGSFTQFTNSLTFDPSTTVGKKYTISFWAKSPNGTTSLLLYNSNGKPKYFNFSTTLTSNLGTEWQFFKHTVTNTQYTGSDAHTNTSLWKRIEIYAPNQMKVQVKQIKVEEGEVATPWCPNLSDELATTMGFNSTTEYDCSGFCNNGIKNNIPIYLSDTAKYSVSTHLNGINQTIQMPNLSTLIKDEVFTFNIWFKRLQSEPSSKAWETIFGGPSGFEIETCSANNVHDNKIKAYSWGSGTFEFEFDRWNMLTLVRTASDSKFYLNGELKLTGTKGTIPSGNYFLGSWSNTSTQNYKGYLSDARIYVTALSADDIKNLYQNSAYISSNGTAYAYEFVEV